VTPTGKSFRFVRACGLVAMWNSSSNGAGVFEGGVIADHMQGLGMTTDSWIRSG